MKQIISILSLILSLNCVSQNQSDTNNSAYEEYQKADKELNEVYKKILIKYKSDLNFIEKLKKAQRIWISYRDAELEMKFPEKNKRIHYGSVYPMCISGILKGLTVERTNKLMIWLKGIEEGETCLGSVKLK